MTSKQPLAGKVAYISGGTGGINLGIAKRLAEAGAILSVIGRDADKAARAAAEISALNERETLHFSADVRDYDAVNASFAETAAKLGAVDIVIAGAAGNFFAPAVDISPNGFKTVVEIDLIGTWHVFRAAYDHRATDAASFIAITAPQAEKPWPFQAHACAAKAGVNALLKTLAMEWGPAGIRVNGISPGLIRETEGLKRLFANNPAEAEKMVQALALKRLGSVRDIGEAALWLGSEASSYMTGVVLDVDGGYALGDASADCLTSHKP